MLALNLNCCAVALTTHFYPTANWLSWWNLTSCTEPGISVLTSTADRGNVSFCILFLLFILINRDKAVSNSIEAIDFQSDFVNDLAKCSGYGTDLDIGKLFHTWIQDKKDNILTYR